MTSSLTPHQSVAVGSLCDNVEVDPETGDLWLGCHPNAWKAFMYDHKDPPGSEVCVRWLFHMVNDERPDQI